MLKKSIIISSLVLIPLMSPLLPLHASQSSSVDTTVKANWKLDAQPLDMVHTLDNKRVFIRLLLMPTLVLLTE